MRVVFRMEVFMKMFAMNIPQNELAMRAKVAEKGDPVTVLNNDTILRELNEFENSTSLKQGSESSAKIRGNFTVKELKDELHENLETAIHDNFQIFERKFTLHQNQLQEQLTKSLAEVIVAVREGPHDKIKNHVSRQRRSPYISSYTHHGVLTGIEGNLEGDGACFHTFR